MFDRDDHLHPYFVHELAAGFLNASESERAQAHLQVCGRCRAELALARSFVDTPTDLQIERDGPSWSVGRRRRGPVWRAGRWGLLAASIALVVVGVREFRTLSLPVLESDGAVRSIDPRGQWPLHAERSDVGWMVRWSAVAEVAGYTVTAMGPDGGLVWSAETGMTELEIPASALAGDIPEAGILFVRVTARLENGDEQQSGLLEIEVP